MKAYLQRVVGKYFIKPTFKMPKKLYSSQHQFITFPKKRTSFLGFSDYAKRCLIPDFMGLVPGLSPCVLQSINYFRGNIFSLDDDPVSLLSHIPQNLIIRKGQPVMHFSSKQGDWLITAPLDLRVIRINKPVLDQGVPALALEWILQIQVINQKQIQQLLTQQQYQKLWKTVTYE